MPSGFELNPTFSFTLLGSFCIYLWTRPSRWSIAANLLSAAALRLACQWWAGGLGRYYGVSWISWGAFLGIAALIVLAFEVGASGPVEKRQKLNTFYAASVFPLFSLLIGYTVPLYIWLCPRTYDLFLLAIDGRLGFQPSFLLGRLLTNTHTAWGLTTVVYYMLPLMASVVYASHRAQPRKSVALLPLFLSLMIVGFGLYPVYPAVGPAYAFPKAYPNHPPNTAQISLAMLPVADAPRNCMPSLHLAGALIVLWNSRQWPIWGRLLSALFFACTAFTTLALGEHYLIDLVVAYPFALAFQAGWTTTVPFSELRRKAATTTGIGLTLAWFILLHFAWRLLLASSLFLWALIVLTVSSCVVLERRLARLAEARVEEANQTS